ncbi:MAG TPA: glycosyltransferase [Candidatus Saccharimonadales bacterium]|nr:glycosyltransferase [Candidatus Saccharimonadales bacterium]
MKVAIVHDWLVSPGGAEQVVLELHKLWPKAPIYTAAYEPSKFPEFKDADVRPTWLNKIGLAKRKHQLFSIPRAWAFKGLDLSEYDVVISSSSAESKYVKTGPNTLHICYCHTPIRYYWSDFDWYRQHPPFGKLNWLASLILPFIIGPLRRMDYKAAQKIDLYVANSENVRKRIKKYYNRDAVVIYPPVATGKFKVKREPQDFYLIVGRQVAYKRLDLAVDAFNDLELPLKVAGAGEEIGRQRSRSKSNIEYLGRVNDEELAVLYAQAKAFIFPPEEDFGIVPVEAQSAGCPVVAYGKGGALETVVDGETGVFFTKQTPEALADAVKLAAKTKFDEAKIRHHAKQFDAAVFARKISHLVDSEWQKFSKK